MQLKKIACTVALLVLLASPCAASPWTDLVVGFLDSIVKLPLTLAALSEQEKTEEAPLPEPLTPEVPGELTQTDGLDSEDPPTEKGPDITPDG